jgi:hypothetical protein
MPGFGFGILMLSQLAAQVNSSGSLTYRSLYQFVPAMGFGVRLLDGVLRIGYSLLWVNEATGTQTVAVSNSIGWNQNLYQGSGLSNNIGIALVAPIRTLPALNFVVRNLFGTSYSASMMPFPLALSSLGTPATDPMSFDASLSFQPRIGNGAILNLVVEDRDITNNSGMAFIGHWALGGEIDFRNRIFLRGGWGSGYPSAGLGLKSPGMELSLAWFTEEIGTSYLSQGDTRYMLQYKLKIY